MAKLKGKFYTFYVTDPHITKFLDEFRQKKQNRNRFIGDLLRVAKRYHDEMAKTLGTIEPEPLEVGRLREPERLEPSQVVRAMDESLLSWKEQKTK